MQEEFYGDNYYIDDSYILTHNYSNKLRSSYIKLNMSLVTDNHNYSGFISLVTYKKNRFQLL